MGISALSSFFGGFCSFILLAFVALPLAKFSLKFGPPEYFAVLLFGFAAVVGLAEKQYLRALMTMALGMLISMIGMDFLSGAKRYVYTLEMYEGIDFSVISLGLFGIAEMMAEAEKLPVAASLKEARSSLSLKALIPSWAEIKECIPCIFRGTCIGMGIGILPAAGATIATFITYSTEKSLAKDPSKFGKGYIVGVAGPEASNNASVGGSIIPTLALGIPGTATTAVILGAMTMFGLQTGPRVFETSGLVVWTLIAGLFVANFMLLLSNTLLIPFFVWIIDVGQKHLKAIIVVTVMIGVFGVTYGIPQMYVGVLFGVLGYFFKKLKYPPGPFLLALVLFPKIEISFRQALTLSVGDYGIFVRGPIAITFIALSVFAFVYPLIKDKITAKNSALSATLKGIDALEDAVGGDNGNEV
jgi:putative tricarboxylic transport membrane protein